MSDCHTRRRDRRRLHGLDGRRRRRSPLTPRRKDQPVPEPGQLLRRELLGSEAVYRVVGENDRGVEVEVVDVQGLTAGSRFTFRLEDVFSMERLPAETHTRREPARVVAGRVRRPA